MLLSRLAETVFWLGRYVERAEDLARAISAHEQLCLDLPVEWSPGWTPLIALCGEATPSFADAASEREAVLKFLVAEPDNGSSVLNIISRAREDLRMSRPIVPKETWYTLNAAHISLEEVSRAPSLVSLTEVLNDVVTACQQVNAQISAAMTHDDAYAFLRMGRYIERANMLLQITTIMSAFDQEGAPKPFADLRWMALLNALGAYQMYRRNHHGRVDPARAVSFLLAEVRFPRSLNHCVREVERQLRTLPKGALLEAACDRCKAQSMCGDSPSHAMGYAEERLGEVQRLATMIEATYFH